MSSDFARAVATAEGATGAPLSFEPLLRERNFGVGRAQSANSVFPAVAFTTRACSSRPLLLGPGPIWLPTLVGMRRRAGSTAPSSTRERPGLRTPCAFGAWETRRRGRPARSLPPDRPRSAFGDLDNARSAT